MESGEYFISRQLLLLVARKKKKSATTNHCGGGRGGGGGGGEIFSLSLFLRGDNYRLSVGR